MLGCTASTDPMSLQCPMENNHHHHSRRWVEVAPNCPRCASPNTKFCYYNNYSLSQPRYFCKGCRRYWTKGGSLRNVPVGGGCRKSRRAKSALRASRRESALSATGNCSYMESESQSQSDITSSGSDIDLAAVFAKFVDQGLTNLDRQQPKISGEELMNLADRIGEFDAVNEEKQKQELESKFGGQSSLLSDEMVQEALWSDDAANSGLVPWQPMVQLQEFDSFCVEDEQLNSADFIIDNNWSSLDLSGLEVFSRP